MRTEAQPKGSTLAQGVNVVGVDEADGMAFAAVDVEARAQALVAQSADLENLGLATVARFEAQRSLVLELLGELNGAEVAGGPTAALRGRFLAAEHEKQRLWGNVERLWADSQRCIRRAADLDRLAQVLRRGAEGLWRSEPAPVLGA